MSNLTLTLRCRRDATQWEIALPGPMPLDMLVTALDEIICPQCMDWGVEVVNIIETPTAPAAEEMPQP